MSPSVAESEPLTLLQFVSCSAARRSLLLTDGWASMNLTMPSKIFLASGSAPAIVAVDDHAVALALGDVRVVGVG